MNLPKILIVDDENETRQTLNDFLANRIECEIIEAENGYEATEKLEKNLIDLILLDINMPGISGIEVIKKAKEISNDIAVIVVTKIDSSTLSDQIEQLGALYIPKPLPLKIVQKEVESKLRSINKFFEKKRD